MPTWIIQPKKKYILNMKTYHDIQLEITFFSKSQWYRQKHSPQINNKKKKKKGDYISWFPSFLNLGIFLGSLTPSHTPPSATRWSNLQFPHQFIATLCMASSKVITVLAFNHSNEQIAIYILSFNTEIIQSIQLSSRIFCRGISLSFA